MIVIAGLAGLPRLLLSRRFAELQQAKLKGRQTIPPKFMSLVGLVGAVVFAGLYFTRWGHEAWVPVAIIFSLLSAAEFYFQARFPSLDSLVFQNRLLGILYLGLSVGSYLLLRRA